MINVDDILSCVLGKDDIFIRSTVEKRLRAALENAAQEEADLLGMIPYPYCPSCQSECKSVDEDGCCSTCGSDVIRPTWEHVHLLIEHGHNLGET